MDAEHRPTSLMSDVRVSIVQVATRKHVFLLDFLALPKVLSGVDWHDLMARFFSAPNITILGYGLKGDLRNIASSVEALEDLESACQNWLDLEMLEKVVTGATSGIMQAPFLTEERGLSSLAQAYLGKPMDKRDQVGILCTSTGSTCLTGNCSHFEYSA